MLKTFKLQSLETSLAKIRFGAAESEPSKVAFLVVPEIWMNE